MSAAYGGYTKGNVLRGFSWSEKAVICIGREQVKIAGLYQCVIEKFNFDIKETLSEVTGASLEQNKIISSRGNIYFCFPGEFFSSFVLMKTDLFCFNTRTCEAPTYVQSDFTNDSIVSILWTKWRGYWKRMMKDIPLYRCSYLSFVKGLASIHQANTVLLFSQWSHFGCIAPMLKNVPDL